MNSGRAKIILIIVLAACCISIPIYWLVDHSLRKHERLSIDRSLRNHEQLTADVIELNAQLERYKTANGHYPTTEQGLQALVRQPRTLPRDPWRGDYIYACPVECGKTNTISSQPALIMFRTPLTTTGAALPKEEGAIGEEGRVRGVN